MSCKSSKGILTLEAADSDQNLGAESLLHRDLAHHLNVRNQVVRVLVLQNYPDVVELVFLDLVLGSGLLEPRA